MHTSPVKSGISGWLAAASAAVLFTAGSAWAQQVKLYLKDGSQLLVKSYQVEGDKVRFYNLDTHEYEEMPAALVDFDATKHAAGEESAAHEKVAEEAKELEKEHFGPAPASAPEQAGFQVRAGLYLPMTEGVYAYDGLRVIPMIQSSGEVVTDKERMALTLAIPAPLLKKRSLVALDGAQAAVRIVNPQPVFYIEAGDAWGGKAVLIPVKSSHDSRIVEKVQSGMGLGASGEIRDAVPVEKEPVAKGIYKLQPSQPLDPGEYAIGELVDGKLNLEVWDFGIDKPGKKVAPVEAGAARQAAMGEQRPGETPRQPTDMIPGIPHPHNPPNGPPPPGPDSQGVPPSPANAPGSSGPPN